ncbi:MULTISPECIES: histidine triad nucleotide-binding protein [Methylomonas]|uniref:histidine triad nucleotide-binding protein n=1 Tax=Methylomonas TaxID=416 RepID=UPI001232E8F1|nr:histidine triad nucleotide-binding protein [Methylomonas rhizoryzae]
MTDCLFCKMASGDIKPDIVYENDSLLAFRDINPQAPTHVLLIPKRHIANLNGMEDANLAGELLVTAAKIANQLGVAENGYRTVINCNDDGGQTVHHLHLHLLAGRRMSWPPG